MIYLVNFALYGGDELCSWDLNADTFDCLIQTPNGGDGYKGNVERDYTWSISLQQATIYCNPASITSKTKGAFEYTEFRPGQTPAYAVRDTPEVDPNTEVDVHFSPALSASSAVAGFFVFVYPSIGPAAACSAAPPRTIP